MLSKATKLRIKFNAVRRHEAWKTEKPRFVIFSREHRDPVAHPWQPTSPHYASFADFMANGYAKGEFYAVPVKPRGDLKEREFRLNPELVMSLPLNPFDYPRGGNRRQMFNDDALKYAHLNGDIVGEVAQMEAEQRVKELNEKGIVIYPMNDIHLVDYLDKKKDPNDAQ